MKCKKCGIQREGGIEDEIPLCHMCYLEMAETGKNPDEVSKHSTCHICKEDSKTEDMVADIAGTLYCYVCADICWTCGVYQHQCEEEVNA